jgi:hypothetical protein
MCSDEDGSGKCSKENRMGYEVTNEMVRSVHEVAGYTKICIMF